MTFPEERAAITEILERTGNSVCLVDLGAHLGEDTAWMLEVLKDHKDVQAVMIEADRLNFNLLVQEYFPNVSDEERQQTCLISRSIIAGHFAIADRNGSCDFYSCTASGGGFGSVYRPIPDKIAVSVDDFRLVRNIPCIKLDTLFDLCVLESIDLLWVDIHGAEKDMIAHGQKALSRTKYMMIEAVAESMYEGAAMKSELIEMLPGWTVLKEFPWNLLLKNNSFACL